MDGLQTVDYYWINELVAANTYLVEEWERRMAKSAMTEALHWSRYEDDLNKKRIRRMKERGLVVETKPLEL
jgi:hypothetical protein